MVEMITDGIKVSVETFYLESYSNPLSNNYMFSYRITILNTTSFPMQLLSRKWNIFDSTGIFRQVEGEGVVGVQPVISSGESYEYVSGCNLQSDMGKMYGLYTFKNLHFNQMQTIGIPEFTMVAPFKSN
jgi:ApaG protein